MHRIKKKSKVYYWKKGTSLKYMVEGKIPTKKEFEKDYVKLPVETSETNLDEIWEDYNIGKSKHKMGQKKNQDWLKEHGLSHTTMSVGDIIKVGNKHFIVKHEGWKEILKR